MDKPFDIDMAKAPRIELNRFVAFKTGANRWPAIKHVLDIVLAVILIVMAAPALTVLYVLTRLDGGPSVYGHKRIGRHGHAFNCLKFRSMVTDGDIVLARYLAGHPEAQVEWNNTRKLRHDPRVTRLGKFLRKTSLDELPQLFNVLKGDMSLVGPRPVVESELARYYSEENRTNYLSVRPGVTGLWQVSGRSDVSYTARVALDSKYVRNSSFALDVRILFGTVAVVLFGKGAR